MSETKSSEVNTSSGSGGNVSRSDNDNNWRRAGGVPGNGRGSTNTSNNYKGSNNTSRGRGGSDRFGVGSGGSSNNNSRDASTSTTRRVGPAGEGRGGGDSSGRKSSITSGRGTHDRGSYTSGRGRDSGTGRGRGGGRFDNRGRSGTIAPGADRAKIIQSSTSAGQPTSKLEILKKSNSPATEGGDDKVAPDVEAESTTVAGANDNAEVGTESTSVPHQETSGSEVEVKKREMKKREPDVLNTRAVAFGVPSGDGKREPNARREPRAADNSGPPPILNTRAAAAMAAEEQEKERIKDQRRENSDRLPRGPPPQVTSSRFAKAAEADRSSRPETTTSQSTEELGPPPVINSRFTKAAEADRASRPPPQQHNMDDRGPPAPTNSRFAKAAEEDRSSRSSNPRDDSHRGPPPIANSRFAAAAEADRSSNNNYGDRNNINNYNRGDDNRGPPPVANSRFANAAAMAETERSERPERPKRFDRDDNDRIGSGGSGGGGRGGDYRDQAPLQQNSRFAAAAAADGDYVDRAERERRTLDRDRERSERGGGDRGGDRGGGRGHGRNDRYPQQQPPPTRAELPRGPAGYGVDDTQQQQLPSHVEKLLNSKAKAAETSTVAPTKEQEANMLKFPTKALARDDDENILRPNKKKGDNKKSTEPEVLPSQEKVTPPTDVAASAVDYEKLLNEFVNGGKQGVELREWCESHETNLPSVEKILFHLLAEKEKLNPDVECKWAESGRYGAALAHLVGDDLLNQMQVLWAVQLYCDSIGFPKLNNEAVVQTMFRSMYQHDLVADDAFTEWKEDETDAHAKGKMTAIIQTVDWFNWLEAEAEEEEEEYEE